jgi:hypothetical protein
MGREAGHGAWPPSVPSCCAAQQHNAHNARTVPSPSSSSSSSQNNHSNNHQPGRAHGPYPYPAELRRVHRQHTYGFYMDFKAKPFLHTPTSKSTFGSTPYPPRNPPPGHSLRIALNSVFHLVRCPSARVRVRVRVRVRGPAARRCSRSSLARPSSRSIHPHPRSNVTLQLTACSLSLSPLSLLPPPPLRPRCSCSSSSLLRAQLSRAKRQQWSTRRWAMSQLVTHPLC